MNKITILSILTATLIIILFILTSIYLKETKNPFPEQTSVISAETYLTTAKSTTTTQTTSNTTTATTADTTMLTTTATTKETTVATTTQAETTILPKTETITPVQTITEAVTDAAEPQADIQNAPNEEQPVMEENVPPAETEPLETITYYYYDDWTWIGDSRTVGLSGCVSINSFAKSAMGLTWMKENIDYIYSLRGQTIVINMGVNDLYNVWNYIDLYNSMPEEFTSNNCIYIMSVNPVDEVKERSYGYSTKNASIENFNSIIRDNLRSDFFYMDCYSYLVNKGFGTTDGLHYDYNTYVDIYNYMITSITGA